MDRKGQTLRNRETQARHKRETLLQITLPLVFGGLLVLAAFVLPVLAVAGGGDVSKWADTSLIWLVANTGLVCLFPLIILGSLVYLMSQLLKATPGQMYRVQTFFNQVNQFTIKMNDKIVEPVLYFQSRWAEVETLMKKIRRKSKDSR